MKQFVVYTVLTGGYDIIQQPTVVDDRFDYVVFTKLNEKSTKKIGVWQVKTFDYTNNDKTRESRYPKMHPNELLNQYKASLYIDANVHIIGHAIYERFFLCYNKGIDWGVVDLVVRDCIYQEAFYVVTNGFDKEINMFKWCHRLRQEGYLRHKGEYSNNVIFRRHNERVLNANRLWWDLYLQYSRRDQTQLPYVFWRCSDVLVGRLLPVGQAVWLESSLCIKPHSDSKNRTIKSGILRHYLIRCINEMTEKQGRFDDFYYWLCGVNPNLASLLYRLFEIYLVVAYAPIALIRVKKRHRTITDEI